MPRPPEMKPVVSTVTLNDHKIDISRVFNNTFSVILKILLRYGWLGLLGITNRR